MFTLDRDPDDMSETAHANTIGSADGKPDDDAPMSREWHWHPELPLDTATPFVWPPNISAMWRWLSNSWFSASTLLVFLATAGVTYAWFQPSPEAMCGPDWIAVLQIWLRNLILLSVFAGGLHVYLYRWRVQGKKRKFDPRDLARSHKAFMFRSQVRDNMFWSLASGVTFWTAYEVLYYWAAANGYAPGLTFAGSPVWFVAWFVLIPLWSSMHFYWVHRLLHWPPLYRAAHALHHRNINIGPWSGVSMHPIEHVLYYSNILIHFLVPSHPLHVLFHMHVQNLSPVCSHSGFESLFVKDQRQIGLGDFFHQLHHRYFECNYGTAEMPWDQWFGSYHDGTQEARERIRRHIAARHDAAQV